jgi:hypothetical protein
VAASPSTEARVRRRTADVGRQLRRAAQDLRRLRADESLALAGVAIILGSLVLPWFGVPLQGDLVQTGFGGFGFAEAALVLTAAATLLLLVRAGDGWIPPRPVREWGLLVAAGAWAIVIVVVRMIDRPSFDLDIIDVHQRYGLRYGIFIALAGAALILVSGLRVRSRELAADE